jgi:membrane-anchored glycerophosphoryl diester phosphodiesterase (GDPDase)
LFILFLVVFIYLSMRLGQAGWFAADGMGAIDAIKASWNRTQGHLLKILLWSIGGAFVFTAIGALIGLLTSSLPDGIGSSIGTGVGLVFTYASGSVLYRRITAK